MELFEDNRKKTELMRTLVTFCYPSIRKLSILSFYFLHPVQMNNSLKKKNGKLNYF